MFRHRRIDRFVRMRSWYCEMLEDRTLLSAASMAMLPLSFEPNVGQTSEQVQYLSRGEGYNLFLTPGEAVLSLHDTSQGETVLRARVLGGNPNAPVAGLDQQEGHVNYYIGNDPSKWHSEIPLFGRVQYQDVYPGIDLVYYGTNQQQLEYDFVVAPGTDPSIIKLAYEGGAGMSLDAQGNLVLHTAVGDLIQQAPVLYQDVDGVRREVAGSFALRGGEVGFDVGTYDTTRPLVIDPVLVFSTFHGGSGADEALGVDVATNGNGFIYVTGHTRSTNFPTAGGASDTTRGGSSDAFVTQLNAAGTSLSWSTYLGGSSQENDLGTVGGHGAVKGTFSSRFLAYVVNVTGFTQSADFPLVSPLDATLGGSQDAFVSTFRESSGALLFSTYLGGTGNEAGSGIAAAGNDIYVTGWTSSADFPVVNALQPSLAGGLDGFVARLNLTTPAAYTFATYLGGANDDVGQSIGRDSAGNLFLAGRTESPDFPTTFGLDQTLGGSADAYVAKLNSTGSSLLFSTFLGGSGNENYDPAHAATVGNLAVDGLNNAYVTGSTSSSDFPYVGSYDNSLAGTWDAYVTKFDAVGTTVYSTYLGGTGNDFGMGIAVDLFRNAFVTGYTESSDFPTFAPTQAVLAGSRDAFVTAFDPLGIAPVYSTFLGGAGGSEGDIGRAIFVNRTGQPIVVGFTDAAFPTQNPRQGTSGGAGDAFITRIGVIPGASIAWGSPNNNGSPYVPGTFGVADVVEGGATDTYTVVLNAPPTSNVIITMAPDAQSTVSPATLTFTPANWTTAQVVTVTAVDDAADESRLPARHSGIITHTATSADAVYDGIGIPGVSVFVSDNDFAGTFNNSTNLGPPGFALFETGPSSDFYTLQLISTPTANVIVTLNPDAQVTVAPATLTYTPATWSTPQTVTVTAVDDLISESSPHNGVISAIAGSADAAYNGLALANVTIPITDNDNAVVAINNLDGSIRVWESGPTDLYTVVLGSPPTADVFVTINPGSQHTVAALVLTFTALDWSTPQTVTVTALDDLAVESLYPASHAGTITHSATSADPVYNLLPVASLTSSVFDNDTVGIYLSQSGGTTAVLEEGPTTDTYIVVLTSTPTASVFITVTSDSQVATAPTVLTFTPTTWWSVQTVNLTPIDDGTIEGPHTGLLTHTVTSGMPAYNAFALTNITVTITDNDAIGLLFLETFTTTDVNETGATSDIYSVRLRSLPTANVVVTLDPGTQLTLSTTVLTFAPANWNIPQTVTVTAVDDLVAESPTHIGLITHVGTSADLSYNTAFASLSVNITDDDTAGISLVETGAATTLAETGGTDTYTLVLTSQPTADVLVTLSPDAQQTTVPAVLTFTPLNWNAAQTVTVTAVDDFMVETRPHQGVVTHVLTSADPMYNGLTVPAITASIMDDDVGGVAVTQSGGATDVTEGLGPDSYTVVLTSVPRANVVITIAYGTQITGSSARLTFTPANWNVVQTLTVTAVDDLIFEGPHTALISHSPTSADPVYNATPIGSVTVNITDNDYVAINQSSGSTRVTESGATDSYAVFLNSQPTANVFLTFDPGSQVLVSPAPLTFTPLDWNIPQTVTVTAVDDFVAETATHMGTIGHTTSSGDPFYNNVVVPNVTAQITDNDTASVTVTLSGGSTGVTEAGTGDDYSVVLNSQPTANVTIIINPDPALIVAPTMLVFTSANWNVPQTVTVTAADDGLQQGTRTRFITHVATSPDPFYQSIAVPSVTVTLNDPPGVTLTPVSGQNAILEGVTQSYAAILNTPPLAPVTIDLAGDSQTIVAPAQIVFTPGNWNVPRPVVLLAVDDTVVEGAHSGNVGLTVTSADANYDNLGTISARVGIVDNDGDPILGTNRADQIVVTSAADGSRMFVSINSKVTILPATLSQLVIQAGDGADNIQITSPLLPVIVLGGSGSDKLFVTGALGGNTFQLDSGHVQVNGVSVQFWQAENLVIGGLAGNDILRVQGMPGIAAEFKGELGNDQIFGPNRGNAWSVTSANGGVLNRTFKINGVENWIGGSLADSFAFAAGKSLSGVLDGGGGFDTLDFSAGSSAVTVNLQSSIATGSQGYRNIARVIGSRSTADRLIGPDQSNVWNITGASAGNVAGIVFQGFENLNGGLLDDVFRFADRQGVKGKIEGGTGFDVLDYSAYTIPVTVNLQTRTATGTAGVFNLEQFIAGSGTKPDTLIGPNLANTWTLTGAGSGTVGAVAFSSFENLTGGSLADSFLLDSAGDWLGSLNGGSGTDLLLAYSGRLHVWVTTGKGAGTLDGRKFLGIEALR